MSKHELLRNGKAEAHSAAVSRARRFRPIEPVEDKREMLGFNARSRDGNRHPHARGFSVPRFHPLGRYGDFSAGRG